MTGRKTPTDLLTPCTMTGRKTPTDLLTPLYNRACISICAHVNNLPTWQPYLREGSPNFPQGSNESKRLIRLYFLFSFSSPDETFVFILSASLARCSDSDECCAGVAAVSTSTPRVLSRAHSFFKCCFTSTKTIRTKRNWEPRTAAPTVTHLLSSDSLLFSLFFLLFSFFFFFFFSFSFLFLFLFSFSFPPPPPPALFFFVAFFPPPRLLFSPFFSLPVKNNLKTIKRY